MAESGFAAAKNFWEQPVRAAVRVQFCGGAADPGALGAKARLLSGLVALGIISISLLLWGAIIAPLFEL